MKQNIGKYIRLARTGASKTVREVSEYLKSNGMDISEKTIYGWENGHSQPSPDALLLLCSFCGIDDVLGHFGYNKSPAPESEADLRKEVILKNYEVLTEEGKNAVVEYTNLLATSPKFSTKKPSAKVTMVAMGKGAIENTFEGVTKDELKRQLLDKSDK